MASTAQSAGPGRYRVAGYCCAGTGRDERRGVDHARVVISSLRARSVRVDRAPRCSQPIQRRASSTTAPSAPRRRTMVAGNNEEDRRVASRDPADRDEQSYRECAECGGDCTPEPVPTEQGMRIAFTCPQHGVHSFLDPFNDLR